MDIERERGITIKAQTVRLDYKAKDGKTTSSTSWTRPGHVDFAYEVVASLAACEGALLVVDASQGVEAQTLANVYQALDADLEIVPVLNKIDLPAAEPERVKQQIEDVIGLDASRRRRSSRPRPGSASTSVLEAIVTRLPPPKGDADAPLKGAAGRQLVRRLSRRRRAGARHRRRSAQGRAHQAHDGRGADYDVDRVGVFSPEVHATSTNSARAKSASSPRSIKEVADTRVGDTITDDRRADREGAAGLQAGAAGRVLRALPGRRRRFRGPARPPWRSSASTTRASPTRWKPRPRSASASAAASSACCIWKSSRSA